MTNSPGLRLSAIVALIVMASSCVPTEGFFFSSPKAKSASPPAQWYSIRDYNYPSQSAFSYDSSGGVAVAVPVAVPIAQQKLAPVASKYQGAAPVQLVPCLCPISRDPELVKSSPAAANSVSEPTDPNKKQR